MINTFEYRGLRVEHHRKPSNRHTYLQIRRDGTVCVRTPLKARRRIEAILDERGAWIEAKLAWLRAHAPEADDAQSIFYLGTRRRIDSDDALQPLRTMLARMRRNQSAARQAKIDAFYLACTKTLLSDRVEHFSKRMGLTPTSISFRKMKRRWGSCSGRGALTFNTMLIKLEPALIDYVVVHELAHLRHMNHSRRFYDCVEAVLPDYRNREASLRAAGLYALD